MEAPDTKAIVFDCFGVLYLNIKRSLLDLVSRENHQKLTDLFTSNNYGYFDRLEYLDQVAELTGLSTEQASAYIAAEHHLNSELVILAQEKLRNRYKVGLLSNIGRQWIDDFFSEHQLHELFDEVVLSGEEGLAKPHPAIFELMAARLGVAAHECVMIDDIQANCEGAEIAGMQSIHFVSNEQLVEALHDMKLL